MARKKNKPQPTGLSLTLILLFPLFCLIKLGQFTQYLIPQILTLSFHLWKTIPTFSYSKYVIEFTHLLSKLGQLLKAQSTVVLKQASAFFGVTLPVFFRISLP